VPSASAVARVRHVGQPSQQARALVQVKRPRIGTAGTRSRDRGR
jgi:hypothetical protein